MYQLAMGVRRLAILSSARGPKVIGDRPDGALRHFCEPL